MNRLSQSLAQIKKLLFRYASRLCTPNGLSWLFICLGVVLRLAQYLFDRSLWLDESFLALNITDRSFSELLQPLDYYQCAPVGFLLLEKSAVQAFGNSEYSLRLFPLLSGIASLFLFYGVAKQCIEPRAVPIALGLFAISDPLIYYSSEAKQYSSDVAIALLLCSATAFIQSKRLTAPRVALLGILGAAAIWFSLPSVFILAGVGTSLVLFYSGKRDWAQVSGLSIACSLWALSFVVCYFVSLRSLVDQEILLDYWADAFAPFPPVDLVWFVNTFFSIFENPVGLSLPGIAALTFIVGCITMFSEKRQKFFILLSPIFFTLMASAFQKYPFKERLLLFVVPSLLLLIAEGAAQIRDKTRHNSAVIGLVVIGLLFFHPSCFSGYHLIRPRTVEEIRPVISYIREHEQNKDVLYLYYASEHAFKYYSERYGFKNNDYVVGSGSSDWQDYIDDLNRLEGNKRVWLLFSHTIEQEKENFFLDYLDSMGTRLDSYKSAGAAVYLYDLSKEARISER